jgi:preprotein translocase subunit SecG
MLAQAQGGDALIWLLGTVFVINAVAMIVFVLFRQGDSGGIGAAFGGGDSGGAFGTKGQKVVDKVLTFMGATFIVLAFVFNFASTQKKAPDTRGIQDAPSSTSEGSE